MSEPLDFKAEAAELAFQVAVCVARGDVERSEKACDNFLREAAAKALDWALVRAIPRTNIEHVEIRAEIARLRAPSKEPR